VTSQNASSVIVNIKIKQRNTNAVLVFGSAEDASS
jgi:hypothetical protein